MLRRCHCSDVDECDLSDLEDVLSESSVEINKHKILDANNS